MTKFKGSSALENIAELEAPGWRELFKESEFEDNSSVIKTNFTNVNPAIIDFLVSRIGLLKLILAERPLTDGKDGENAQKLVVLMETALSSTHKTMRADVKQQTKVFESYIAKQRSDKLTSTIKKAEVQAAKPTASLEVSIFAKDSELVTATAAPSPSAHQTVPLSTDTKLTLGDTIMPKNNDCTEDTIIAAYKIVLGINIKLSNALGSNDYQIDINPALNPDGLHKDLSVASKEESALQENLNSLDRQKSYFVRTGTNDGSGHYQLLAFKNEKGWYLYTTETNQKMITDKDGTLIPEAQVELQGTSDSTAIWGMSSGEYQITIQEASKKRIIDAANFVGFFRAAAGTIMECQKCAEVQINSPKYTPGVPDSNCFKLISEKSVPAEVGGAAASSRIDHKPRAAGGGGVPEITGQQRQVVPDAKSGPQTARQPKISTILNNCPFYVLTPELKEEIEKYAEDEAHENGHTAGYNSLKEHFSHYYNLENISWKDFSGILQNYNPFDVQLVLGPVLRSLSKETMQASDNETFIDIAAAAYSDGKPITSDQYIKLTTEINKDTGRYDSLSPDHLFKFTAHPLGLALTYNKLGQSPNVLTVDVPVRTISIHHQGRIDVAGHWERVADVQNATSYEDEENTQLTPLLPLLGGDANSSAVGLDLLKTHVQLMYSHVQGREDMTKAAGELMLAGVQIERYITNSMYVPKIQALKLLGKSITEETKCIIDTIPTPEIEYEKSITEYLSAPIGRKPTGDPAVAKIVAILEQSIVAPKVFIPPFHQASRTPSPRVGGGVSSQNTEMPDDPRKAAADQKAAVISVSGGSGKEYGAQLSTSGGAATNTELSGATSASGLENSREHTPLIVVSGASPAPANQVHADAIGSNRRQSSLLIDTLHSANQKIVVLPVDTAVGASHKLAGWGSTLGAFFNAGAGLAVGATKYVAAGVSSTFTAGVDSVRSRFGGQHASVTDENQDHVDEMDIRHPMQSGESYTQISSNLPPLPDNLRPIGEEDGDDSSIYHDPKEYQDGAEAPPSEATQRLYAYKAGHKVTNLFGDDGEIIAAINLTDEQCVNFTQQMLEEFKAGSLKVTAPAGHEYSLNCTGNIPQAILTRDGLKKFDEDNGKPEEEKLRIILTVMNMVDSILARGCEVNVTTEDPFLAEMIQEYINHLKLIIPAFKIEDSVTNQSNLPADQRYVKTDTENRVVEQFKRFLENRITKVLVEAVGWYIDGDRFRTAHSVEESDLSDSPLSSRVRGLRPMGSEKN